MDKIELVPRRFKDVPMESEFIFDRKLRRKIAASGSNFSGTGSDRNYFLPDELVDMLVIKKSIIYRLKLALKRIVKKVKGMVPPPPNVLT